MEKVRMIMSRYNSLKPIANGDTTKPGNKVTSVVVTHSSSGSSFAHCYG